MGNFRWVERRLHQSEFKGQVLELGAGDGVLVKRLNRKGFQVCGLDLTPRPSGLPDSIDWLQGDLFEKLDKRKGAVVATLFLHHFDEPALRRLGRLLECAEIILFAEPVRSSIALLEGYALFPFMGKVTRHDMMISIRAGFQKGELPEMLGLNADWRIQEETTWMGGYRLFGIRNPSPR